MTAINAPGIGMAGGGQVQPLALPRDPAAASPARAAASPATRVLVVGRIMIGLISLVLLALIGRVIVLQTTPPAPIAELIGSQFSRTPLPARRGALVDVRGRLIAATRVAHTLFVDPALIEDPGTFSEYVGYSLNYDPASVEQKIAMRPDSRFVVIDPRLSDERLARLGSFSLSGLATAPRLVRDYPQGPLAAHVIGFVGADNIGLEGLERTLDPQLRGSDGQIRYLRDARCRPLWVEPRDYHPNADGQNVRLTLDLAIQQIVEEELAATVAQFRASGGQVIVLRPATGEILAMANHPAFDPNAFDRVPPDQRRNRCVTDVYEPGSIFKPFMWAAITDTGLMKPTDRVDTTDSGFWVAPFGRRIRDVRGHGLCSWEEVLVYSSNIGMAIGGLKVRHSQLRDAVLRFGFGAPTGSKLPGEVGGMVTAARKWSNYSQTSVTMGYEIGVTALQLTAAFAALANHGRYVAPTILADAVDDPARPAHQAVSPEAAAATRRAMARVVEEGTGKKARSDLYPIYGKTGTAHVPIIGGRGYLPDQYVSSFLAGAPLDDPQIVVLCSIHRPDKSIGHYGGTVAAPAVKNIIERTLVYLGVPARTTPSPRNDRIAVTITD